MVFMPASAVVCSHHLIVDPCIITLEMVISRAKKAYMVPIPGRLKPFGKVHIESYEERSVAQRKDCCLSSIEDGKKRNIAIRIGNCRSIGIHPAMGLPCLL